MYSQQKDILSKVYGRCYISLIFKLSVYSLFRFCLLLFCIFHLFYALVLSPFLFDTACNESGIEVNKRCCTKHHKNTEISINSNTLEKRNSESISWSMLMYKRENVAKSQKKTHSTPRKKRMPDVTTLKEIDFPNKRLPSQRYIFVSVETVR